MSEGGSRSLPGLLHPRNEYEDDLAERHSAFGICHDEILSRRIMEEKSTQPEDLNCWIRLSV